MMAKEIFSLRIRVFVKISSLIPRQLWSYPAIPELSVLIIYLLIMVHTGPTPVRMISPR